MTSRIGLTVYGHSAPDGSRVPIRVHNSNANFLSGVGDFKFIDDWAAGPFSLRKEANASLYPAPMSHDRAALLFRSVQLHEPFISKHTALRTEADGGTIVVVAPGPSSAGIAEKLKPYRSQISVMALNRAGMDIDLAPDYFMCLDAHSKLEWWQGIDPRKVRLITSPMAPGAISEYWAKGLSPVPNVRYFYMRDCGQHDHPAYVHLPMMTGAYSVTTVAVHVACALGYKRVLLVGCDLACSAMTPVGNAPKGSQQAIDAMMYGDGTKGSQTYLNGETLVESVGIDGQMCVSGPTFFQQREAMKVQMEVAWDAGFEVYNCSGTGILDSWVAPLAETLQRVCHKENACLASPVTVTR